MTNKENFLPKKDLKKFIKKNSTNKILKNNKRASIVLNKELKSFQNKSVYFLPSQPTHIKLILRIKAIISQKVIEI